MKDALTRICADQVRSSQAIALAGGYQIQPEESKTRGMLLGRGWSKMPLWRGTERCRFRSWQDAFAQCQPKRADPRNDNSSSRICIHPAERSTVDTLTGNPSISYSRSSAL